jgi:hypothetical protein
MTRSLVIADDFAPDFQAVRDGALSLDYCPREYKGAMYNGIGLGFDPGLKEQIEDVMGCGIDPKLCFFRLGLEGDQTTTYIHADTICADWASVLYLNPPDACAGGTSFWRHKELEWDSMPESVMQDGLLLDARLAEKLNREGNDERFWTRTDHVNMKSNRFITYPTKRFHSRFPYDTWGSSKEQGRLIWVCFYNLTP